MNPVYLVAARRTPVAPVNGAFKTLEVSDLAVPVIQALMTDTGLNPGQIDQLILGNALYGGGNPARLVALAAGLPESVPALTLDTQCCSGLDALRLGAQAIASGQADAILAGGVESTSRRALRAHRPINRDAAPEYYERPAFTPWPDRDPDMADSAARLAHEHGIGLDPQNTWAIDSHAKALAARERVSHECVPLAGLSADAATRPLSERLANRTPKVAEWQGAAINVAGTALQADAAAVCLLVSEAMLARMPAGTRAMRWVADVSGGGPADSPPWAIVPVVQRLFERNGLNADHFHRIELMEAYAVQAIVNAHQLGLPLDKLNQGGGALARGHPIGASGAILAVRAYHEMASAPKGSLALAAIAAAGGLASAVVLEA
ncbi:thiolase family protein [Saccharospirillum impatiens]|uniref:thiolase family protein n=1 Tax=Saccharospirillum impatiens TaxID=169438 RepID=UPI0003FA05EE|nr:thiolase family protein [Saccharospirillum impatiens]